MKIARQGAAPSTEGSDVGFSGKVRIDNLFKTDASDPLSAASVTFEAGARTAWHTHPAEQMLIVVAGRGLAQREGGSIEEIATGDIVWFPAGEKHWHGAAPKSAMTHYAIQPCGDGSVVTWMEKVSDEQYHG